MGGILEKEKTIFRVYKDGNKPYVTIDKGFVFDARLSGKAKAILLYLLCRPDDWEIYETEIAEHFADGITAIRSGVLELVKFQYLERERIRNERGQYIKCLYKVFEVPGTTTFTRVTTRKQGNPKIVDRYRPTAMGDLFRDDIFDSTKI